MPRNNLHLGKRAYVIPLGDTEEAIIFATDDYDPETRRCELSMLFKQHGVGDVFDIDNPGDDCRTLFSYESKSPKFQAGDYNEGDVRRYLKSRFRDFLRQFFRVHDGAERLALLNRQADEHQQEQRRNSRSRDRQAASVA